MPKKETLESDDQLQHIDELTSKVIGDYNADQIQVLEGLEAVRKRPGMYVGDNGKRGLHQMFKEVLDNSVDEALAGHCDHIKVTLLADNSMSVEDNGRGIPVDKHKKMGVSALQVVMTVLHAGGKFDNEGTGGYKTSGGLHGVGVSCTNALSKWMETTVKREGKIYKQRYEQGRPKGDVAVIGKVKDPKETGTTQHWMADETVLTETEYDNHVIKTRMRELAYLNPKVKFEFIDEQHAEESESFFYQRGIPQLVEDVNEGKDTIHPVVYFKKIKDTTEIEVALQYHDGYNTTILAFSNNIHNPDGGTHVSGFSAALTRSINSYARKMGFLKEKDANFSSEDVSDGLTAVISLRLANPAYNSQDKVKLVTPEVQGLTNSLVGDGLITFFEEHPPIARRIVDKSMIAQRAREAARKAAESIRRGNAMDTFGLPGKLSDCVSKEADKCELFLVEGDSAGGSAKQARDRITQAVLPLRGKILNVERARIDKALDNEEIKSLIAALGVGVDLTLGRSPSGTAEADENPELITEDGEAITETTRNGKKNGKGGEPAYMLAGVATGKKKEREVEFDITKLRYGKVIIMTDADVDGEHIRTLLLTFFYRYMKPLISAGNIYLAQPPLFVIKAGSNERYYAMTEKERDEIIKGLKRKNITVQRFKGLGEMNPDELEETTMAPDKRKLMKVKLDKQFEMEIEEMFSRLMGDKVEPRREFIERHAKEALDLDWHY
jgi:DNA gyrase subunit B